MNKPKLLHISTARSWRGGEQQIAYLVQELAKRDWPQAIACIKDAPLHQWANDQGIKVYPLKKRSSLDFSFARRLARIAGSDGYQMWHAHDAHAHGFAVYGQAFFGAKTQLFVSRRVDFPVAQSWLSKFKYNYPGVKRYLAVSDAIASILKASIRFPERVFTVHSANDPQRFIAAPSGKLRSEFPALKDHFWVGNIAALVGHKDQKTFLHTAAHLLEQSDHYQFFIAGKGELEAELKELAQQLGIANKVEFLGFREDVPEIMKDLDCFLFTSEMEGLGTSVLDAFAAKVPVVATRAGGIPEMVEHEKTGLLADCKDAKALAEAVQKIEMDPNLSQQLIDRASAKLSLFSPERMAAKTIEHYQS